VAEIEIIETDVVVVGAGPVGMAIALDLAWRNVRVVVLETRHRNAPPSVKSNHVASRTMEIFRRLGVSEAVRNAGLPADYPNDVAYRTSFLGRELTRIDIPGRADRFSATEGPDAWWPTPEPPHRINQLYLEPVLFAAMESRPQVTVLNRTQFEAFTQDDEGVSVRAARLDGGDEVRINARYLVGCDGGRSPVRKAIGATLSGDAMLQRVQSSYIRAPSLRDLLEAKGGRPAWASFVTNPRRSGNVYAIDGWETWLVHVYLRDQDQDFDTTDRDEGIRQVLETPEDFEYELLGKEDWIGRRLIAGRFRDRRVFICGDAAHLWVPFAGYGMNAGIADGVNLSWVLAATLKGWADPGMLDAYEAERLPITGQVSHFAMNHAQQMARARGAIPEGLEADGPEGDQVRAAFGKTLYDLNVQQYCCAGLNFGYYYDRSPIIAYDGETPPPYSMGDFQPSTVPGARAPHLLLNFGRSLYDEFGPDYTLLRFDPSVDVAPLIDAAKAKGVPLKRLDVSPQSAGDAYSHKLLIARSDAHVAWRGDRVPEDSAALVERLRGAAH
jgi:2-polyprenyl-6-methoxyphenol hydroxylase-like FAD-dependent oxidoreductase